MKTPQELTAHLVNLLDEYLAGKISGNELTQRYNSAICDDFDWDVEDVRYKALDSFDDELALYVEDPSARGESQAYYGPDELLKKVRDFRNFLLS